MYPVFKIRISNKDLVVRWLYLSRILQERRSHLKKAENFCISKLQEIAVRDHSFLDTCLYPVLYYILLRNVTVP